MTTPGTLSNQNWHMFEPSPIETQLALADPVKNPRAVALLGGYQAERQNNQATYEAQLDAMHAQQIQMAQAAAAQHQQEQSLKLLVDGGKSPGLLAAARSSPSLTSLVPSDTSALEAGAQAAATSANVKSFGQGAGAAAQGGITGLTALAPQALGVPLQQGAPALVQAAQIKEAGANARHATGDAGSGAPRVTARIDPFTNTVAYNVAPPKGGALTPDMLLGAIPQGTDGKPMTRLPQAPSRNPNVLTGGLPGGPQGNPNAFSRQGPPPGGKDNPLLGGGPTEGNAPAPQAAPAKAVTSATDAFSNFQRSNPQGAQDAMALAKQKGSFQTKIVGGKLSVVGASGQTYAVQ